MYNQFPNLDTILKIVPLTQRTQVGIILYDVNGKRIQTLVNRVLNNGDHDFTLMPKNSQTLPAGLYLCRVKSGSIDKIIRLVKLK
jgi:hypothetical protein